MRASVLLALVLIAAVGPACKSRKQLPVPPEEDIPREFALQKLRELLPTAEYIYCTNPKDSLKPHEIKAWNIRNEVIQIDLGKPKPLELYFADITQVRLELVGKYYTVRVHTTIQTEHDKDHFQFLWKQESPAKSVVELLQSLKKK
jgi:hypothetical protein